MVIHCRVLFVALVLSITFSISGSNTLCFAKSSSFFYPPAQDTLKVRDLLKTAQDQLYKGDINLAIKNIESAESLSDSLNYEYGMALVEVRKADVFIYTQKIDTAVIILQRAIDNFPESRARPHFYNQLAAAYSYKGQPIQSIENYTKALDFVYLMTDDRQDHTKAAILVNMASAYQKLGDKANTFSNYLEGLKFAESSKDTVFTVITLNNLGDAYNTYLDFDKADYYLEKAMELALEKDYKSELLRIYLNLGNTKTSLDEIDEALNYYDKALALNKIVRPDTPPFQITYNLGNLYLKKMDFKKAKDFYEESLGYCEALNIPQGAYYNYRGLGDLYSKFSQPNTAIEYYSKALDVATKLNLNQFVLELNEKMYISYKQTGSIDKALSHLETFKALSDSISKIEAENTLSELESKIELDRQTQINRLLEEKQTEQESLLRLGQRLNISAVVVIIIILLFLYFIFKTGRERKKINGILNEQKEELEQLNQTKDKLFAIVAHDLRSPMASMQGILYLINSSDMSPKEIKELALSLEPTLQKNVDTLDDLLAWARKQMSGISIDLKHTDSYPIVEDVISKQVFQFEAKQIKVESLLDKNTFIFVDENAFRLIIRNLLANSIKFTESGGTITFDSTYEDHHVIFSITDTGIGIPESLQKNIFEDNAATRQGTNKEVGTGFGLSLCKEFVLRMNGDIYYESTEGEGTTFFVKLPKYGS
ncbi:MAG: tetratricopeptide repeat protein [Balneola sp.]